MINFFIRSPNSTLRKDRGKSHGGYNDYQPKNNREKITYKVTELVKSTYRGNRSPRAHMAHNRYVTNVTNVTQLAYVIILTKNNITSKVIYLTYS